MKAGRKIPAYYLLFRFTCRSGYGAEAANSAVEPHYLKKFRAAAASKAASKAKMKESRAAVDKG